MNLHLRTLFTLNDDSRLLFVNEPDGAHSSAPRLFLGRTQAGNIWRFHAALPEDLVEELDALCADEPSLNIDYKEPPRHAERYPQLLEQHSPIKSVSTGPAYNFPENICPTKPLVIMTANDAGKLQGGFEKLVSELPAWQPFVALIDGDRAVSVCRSVRIAPEAHEAGVETLPAFRGKGHAKDVVAEWARLVRAGGAIPLYSTSWENTASQAVARKLCLEYYGAEYQVV
jgi:hypothetical protein